MKAHGAGADSVFADKDSFHPTGKSYATREDSASLKEMFLGDGVITGWGTIHGRKVCVSLRDFYRDHGMCLERVHAE